MEAFGSGYTRAEPGLVVMVNGVKWEVRTCNTIYSTVLRALPIWPSHVSFLAHTISTLACAIMTNHS